jgi:hypothetical protein
MESVSESQAIELINSGNHGQEVRTDNQAIRIVDFDPLAFDRSRTGGSTDPPYQR